MRTLVLSAIFICSQLFLNAQNTVGLLSYNPFDAYEGYNLFYPHNQGNVFLMNNCGELVQTWEDTTYIPGGGFIMDEDGYMYKCIGRGAASNQWIHAGGGGEGIEIRDWNNNLVWQWFYNDSTHRLHHDIAVMDNGNILAIAWQRYTVEDIVAAGRDTSLSAENEVWTEKIIEIRPIGSDSAEIVWEWDAWDHVVQDFDNTKDNFGVVGDSPELIDLNFNITNADWLHANAMDYNENLDQILISIPKLNEIWILDHSTTTAQAATHNGGLSGMGGDLVFRWGNPQAYDGGDSTDQQLFFQHDAHWMDIGLTTLSPDLGKIMVFNNRVGEDFSRSQIIAPSFDSYESGYPFENGAFLPEEFDWTYQRPDSTNMYSNIVSSSQRLPNGNTLIMVGRHGYAFEINANEEIVWEYKIPIIAGDPVAQGSVVDINQNLNFRMKRYPANFLNVPEAELMAEGYLELDPDTAFCANILGVDEISESEFNIYPNPTTGNFYVEVSGTENVNVAIYNLMGEEVFAENSTTGKLSVNTQNWAKGMYLVIIEGRTNKLIVQ